MLEQWKKKHLFTTQVLQQGHACDTLQYSVSQCVPVIMPYDGVEDDFDDDDNSDDDDGNGVCCFPFLEEHLPAGNNIISLTGLCSSEKATTFSLDI